jgi:ABC-type Co2+ transport system permease subunit
MIDFPTVLAMIAIHAVISVVIYSVLQKRSSRVRKQKAF